MRNPGWPPTFEEFHTPLPPALINFCRNLVVHNDGSLECRIPFRPVHGAAAIVHLTHTGANALEFALTFLQSCRVRGEYVRIRWRTAIVRGTSWSPVLAGVIALASHLIMVRSHVLDFVGLKLSLYTFLWRYSSLCWKPKDGSVPTVYHFSPCSIITTLFMPSSYL